jgi:hypothetical protein
MGCTISRTEPAPTKYAAPRPCALRVARGQRPQYTVAGSSAGLSGQLHMDRSQLHRAALGTVQRANSEFSQQKLQSDLPSVGSALRKTVRRCET